MTHQANYSGSPSAHLKRAEALFLAGDDASLIYCALELRLGVESRMREYLEPLNHIPKAHKKEWAVSKLGKNIKEAFKIEDKISCFTIQHPNGSGATLTLRYIPIARRLKDLTAKIGDYLHHPGFNKLTDQAERQKLRALLDEALDWLNYANSGEFIGAPLMRGGKTIHSTIYLSNEGERKAEILAFATEGAVQNVHVTYMDMPAHPPSRNNHVVLNASPQAGPV
jgi:hypothetical protein